MSKLQAFKTYEEFKQDLEGDLGLYVSEWNTDVVAEAAFVSARKGALTEVRDMVNGCTTRNPAMQKLCHAIEELMRE
jgi:hypothetical protein